MFEETVCGGYLGMLGIFVPRLYIAGHVFCHDALFPLSWCLAFPSILLISKISSRHLIPPFMSCPFSCSHIVFPFRQVHIVFLFRQPDPQPRLTAISAVQPIHRVTLTTAASHSKGGKNGLLVISKNSEGQY